MVLSRHNSSSPGTSGTGTSPQGQPQDDHLNVRLIFEQYALEDVSLIHRKLNFDVERKKEELRMLVGERYRDFIDAADVIGTMKSESHNLFSSLTKLRTQLTLNAQGQAPAPKIAHFSSAELDVASELKLLAELPIEIYECLESQILDLVTAFHYYRLFTQVDERSRNKFRIDGASAVVPKHVEICRDLVEVAQNGLNSETDTQKIAQFMIIQQILTGSTCEKIVGDWLSQRKNLCERNLASGNFTKILVSTLESIYKLFLDPELYSKTAKSIRKPEPNPKSFHLPKSAQNFYSESIRIDESPRISRLAVIIQNNLIGPLASSLLNSGSTGFLGEIKNFEELNEYRKRTLSELTGAGRNGNEIEDLSRLVLGTGAGANLWNYLYQPVFQLKAQSIAKLWIEGLMRDLKVDWFPRFICNEKSFDLISYIWKPSNVTSAGTNGVRIRDTDVENELKMKAVTPGVSEICGEFLEMKFNLLWKDFQTLDDSASSLFISSNLVQSIEKFVEKFGLESEETIGTETGRLFSGILEYVPSLWKILEKNDSRHLRQILTSATEKSWTIWTQKIVSKFHETLQSKMELTEINIASFMPVAELYKPKIEESPNPDAGGGTDAQNFEPSISIRVPLQLNHHLHNLLFSTAHQIGQVGPQFIPKSILNQLRISLGQTVVEIYNQKLTGDREIEISSQTAVQLIFDLKFIQWFHSSLSSSGGSGGSGDELISQLKSKIDPFDWDILNPKLMINMKRFLFENHLTLGLLFSEESHGFIAQNFKTRHSQSYPTPTKSQYYMQLPLLPL